MLGYENDLSEREGGRRPGITRSMQNLAGVKIFKWGMHHVSRFIYLVEVIITITLLISWYWRV